MIRSIKELDRILRGETTQPVQVREGMQGTPVVGLVVLLSLLAVTYGFFMSWYNLASRAEWDIRPLVSAMGKVPLLFALTLLITFPSLYVFNTLVGSRLSLAVLSKLLLASLAVMVTVLASFGPITAFFSVSTTSYPFMILLNVFFFAVGGVLGSLFLLQSLHRLDVADRSVILPPPVTDSGVGTVAPLGVGGVSETFEKELGPLDRMEGQLLGRNVRKVFAIWLLLFASVGGQMSWVLRPFLGEPSKEFAWIRPRGSNFFESVWQVFASFF